MLPNGDLKAIYTLLGVRTQSRAVEEITQLKSEVERMKKEFMKINSRESDCNVREHRVQSLKENLWAALDAVRAAVGEEPAPGDRSLPPTNTGGDLSNRVGHLVRDAKLVKSISQSLDQCKGFLGRHGVLISVERDVIAARLVQFPPVPEEDRGPDYAFHPHFGPVPMRPRRSRSENIHNETSLTCTVLRAESSHEFATSVEGLSKKWV